MPKRLLAIALFFCLGGLLTAWAIGSAFAIKQSQNYSLIPLLLLPIGIGLMRGNPGSRLWAQFWCILFGGFTLLSLALALMAGHQQLTFALHDFYRRGADALPYHIASHLLLALLFTGMLLTLRSQKTKNYFPDTLNWDTGQPPQHNQRDRGPIGNFVHRHHIALTLGTLILAAAGGYTLTLIHH